MTKVRKKSTAHRTLLITASVMEFEDEAYALGGFVEIDEYDKKLVSVGIPNEHHFRDNAKYKKLNPSELNLDSIDIYYREMVKGHLQQVLRKYVSAVMDLNPAECLFGYKVPVLFEIPLHKYEIFTLSTHNLDESTLEGNAEIHEEPIATIGAKLEIWRERQSPCPVIK